MLSVDVAVQSGELILTVKSDRRQVSGQVTVAGESAPFTATFPISVVDDSGRRWVIANDDGLTAVYRSA